MGEWHWYDRPVPRTLQATGAHPLDEQQPTPLSTDQGPEPAGSPPNRPPDPPGLRAQIAATVQSVKRVVRAHIDLAKAEFGEIVGELQRLAALAGIAAGALLVAALILTVGLPLFLGEWIFGSIGWGVLHGILLLTAIAVAALLLAIRAPVGVVGGALGIAVVVGLMVGIVLGLNLTNRAWGGVGNAIVPAAADHVRPLAAALVVLPPVLAIVFGLMALVNAYRTGVLGGGGQGRLSASAGAVVSIPTAAYVGWLAAFFYAYSTGIAFPDWVLVGVGIGGFVVALVVLTVAGLARPIGAFLGGASIGIVLGVVLAAFTAIAFGRRVGAAIGFAATLITWPAAMAFEVLRTGVDFEALKNRFWPQKTIETTKETIEWARERTPLSRKS